MPDEIYQPPQVVDQSCIESNQLLIKLLADSSENVKKLLHELSCVRSSYDALRAEHASVVVQRDTYIVQRDEYKKQIDRLHTVIDSLEDQLYPVEFSDDFSDDDDS